MQFIIDTFVAVILILVCAVINGVSEVVFLDDARCRLAHGFITVVSVIITDMK